MEAEAFYARIADALGRPRQSGLPAGPTVTTDTTAKPGTPRLRELVVEFSAGLSALGGSCELVPPAQVADRARELLADSAVVQVDPQLLDQRVHQALSESGAVSCVEVASQAWRESCAAADWGVTDASALVAETGSVLLCAATGRPRATSLLPYRHMVIAPLSRLVPRLEDAIISLHDAPSQWLMVTGPSRTSDIENDLTIGVHGPGVLHVLIIDEEQ